MSRLNGEQRFSVSACVEELRRQRQDALAPLVRREHELATEERRARAAAQAQRVRERELAAAQDDGRRGERVVAASAPSPAGDTGLAARQGPQPAGG